MLSTIELSNPPGVVAKFRWPILSTRLRPDQERMNSARCSDRFPNEILATIFKLLCIPRTISSTHDLHSCVLVNRHWHNVAMPILWHTFHLDVDGNEVKDVYKDPTRTRLWEGADPEDSEEEEIWNDWQSWMDYENTASPTTDCWGNILPRPEYANMLGVRPYNLDLLFRSTQCLLQRKHPFWMTYYSPFELCRKITVSFVDDSKTAKNKSSIIAIILSCTNLRDFDMFLHLQTAPTRDERNAWAILAYNLSSQPLRTLRIRLKWAKPDLLPISFTHSEASNQSLLPFHILHNCLTHLSLELDHLDVLATEPNFSNFERLKFFAIYACPEHHHTQHPPGGISRLLQSVQVEEMGLSWPLDIATLPLTLTKLSVITSTSGFPLMSVLKRLVNLEIFTSTDAQHIWANSEDQLIQNQSVENEVVGCRRLRVLHFYGELPRFFFRVIAFQCPLLSDVKFDSYVPEEDIFSVIDQCRALHSIDLYLQSDNVVSHLRYSKNLVNITLDIESFPNVVMLNSFLIELPLLERLYIPDWFEDDCEYHFKDLVSNSGWTEIEVNQLRRYMKPHPDGHDYVYLDMRSMRNNGWMNGME